jgi:hypothetical protein
MMGRMSQRQPGEISGRCVVSRNPEVNFVPLHDDRLAIDERAGYCYSLNISAGRVWDLMPSPVAVSVICSALCTEFSVDRESCLRDVSELLDTMRAAGLVRVADGAIE